MPASVDLKCFIPQVLFLGLSIPGREIPGDLWGGEPEEGMVWAGKILQWGILESTF